MDDFRLRFLASDHSVYDGDAKSVTLQAIDGSIGIWAHHVNYITAVVPGTVEYVPSEDREGIVAGERQIVVVSDGILKVENGEAMILVDTAETLDEIDEHRAQRAHEEAKAAMKKASSVRDLKLATGELSRSMSRLGASKKRHKF